MDLSTTPQSSTSSKRPDSEAILLAKKIFRTSSCVAAGCLVLLAFMVPQRDTESVAMIEEPPETLIVRPEERGRSINPAIPSYAPDSSEDLQQTLERYGLWRIENNSTIDPILFTSFPDNLHSLPIAEKKTIFLHSLLPVAMYANRLVEGERRRLLDLLDTDASLPGDFYLEKMPAAWQETLTDQDREWLVALGKRYKAETISQLKKRVRPIPVSLLLAQAALESSWGTSRFALEGNNLFGIRTWGKQGLLPSERDTDSKFRVAKYDTILESVMAYILTLNSHHLHREFRNLRLTSQDPEVLSQGLLYYSETRKSYVAKVNRIIGFNRLKRFDTLQLASLS